MEENQETEDAGNDSVEQVIENAQEEVNEFLRK